MDKLPPVTTEVSFLDRVNIATLLINPENGNIRYANPYACKFYGYTFDDFIKLNIGQLNPQPLNKTLNNLRMAYTGEKDYYKSLHRSATGEDLQIGIFSGPFDLAEEKLVIALIHDNNSNKLAEDKIRSLSRAVEQSPASIVITDTKGKIEYVNPIFSEVTGYSYEEAVGNNPSILKTGDGSRKEIKEMWQTILSGEIWHGEFRNRKKNGDIYWESASISPVFNENGQLTNFVAVKEDITKSREDQNRIAEAYKFNRAILDSSPIGITIYRSDGPCISANPAAGKIMGAAPEILMGQNFKDLQPWKVYGILDLANQALEMNEPVSSELFYQSTFGKEIWVDLTCTPFRFNDEHDQFLLFMFEDITDRKQAELELKSVSEVLATTVSRLEKKDRAATRLREFGEMLQVCNATEETFNVILDFGPKLFPETSGCVFLLNDNSSMVKEVSCWGEGLSSELEFPVDDCWSLRRGQLHMIVSSSNRLPCKHMPKDFPGCYAGFPLIASGDLIGLLHIEWPERHEIEHDVQDFIQNIADMISLSISNTRLRETLRNQSIRDPLTGIFNRRYLDETLVREFPRAKRKNAPIGVMMLDIDHFKLFNDSFGNEAGDLVLKSLGNLLTANTRREDIVCRYGGEEFCVIMPEADLQTTFNRAEAIRLAVNDMNLVCRQVPLGKVTISIGVSNFPDHGESGSEVIQTADRALYRAKEEGRNRVIRA